MPSARAMMTETRTVRAATREDFARIDALLGRSYPALLKEAYPPSLLVMAIPLISRAQPHLIASGTYFVVEDGDTILGAGGWTARTPGAGKGEVPKLGHIRHVVTDHRRVREGVGKALMGHIIGNARQNGIARLECLSTLLAVPFYAACGFKELRPVSIALRPGIDFPAILMERGL